MYIAELCNIKCAKSEKNPWIFIKIDMNVLRVSNFFVVLYSEKVFKRLYKANESDC